MFQFIVSIWLIVTSIFHHPHPAVKGITIVVTPTPAVTEIPTPTLTPVPTKYIIPKIEVTPTDTPIPTSIPLPTPTPIVYYQQPQQMYVIPTYTIQPTSAQPTTAPVDCSVVANTIVGIKQAAQPALDAEIRAISMDLGRRGLTPQSGLGQQEMQDGLLPITSQINSAIAQVCLHAYPCSCP